MKKVQVLMSTYNGERYLREQLDSLIAQNNVQIELLVRDDGSNDLTIPILNQYKEKMRVSIYKGENLKSARSFMDLLFKAPDEFEYYALCDQDDVWNNEKLNRAVKALEKYDDKPALYYCGMSVVNDVLEPYDYYYRDEKYSKSLIMSCLFGDEIAGCTMVFNKNLLKYIREYTPLFLTLHDSWIHRVCLCVHGEVIADPEPLILYRQHSNNVEGMRKRTILEKFRSLMLRKRYFSRLAGEMLAGYKNYLSKEEIEFLKLVSDQSSLKNRVKIALYKSDSINYKERINLFIKAIFAAF